jgi:UDP-N-acetyl-D-mannosaminuronate dehydrogenase
MPEAWALDPAPDCAVVCTHHSAFDYAQLVASGALVVDTRNALKGHQSARIFRL